MNHTIKSIIIVVAITSMLVVGAASMVPIMQNSFASKKSDFKKESNTNTNINTNTNSADSSSNSDATADNTNNINNTATATQSQEQDACAVAVTCPEGSTTVTPPTPTPSNCNGVEDERIEPALTEAFENGMFNSGLTDPDTTQPPGVVCPPGEDEPSSQESVEGGEVAGS